MNGLGPLFLVLFAGQLNSGSVVTPPSLPQSLPSSQTPSYPPQPGNSTLPNNSRLNSTLPARPGSSLSAAGGLQNPAARDFSNSAAGQGDKFSSSAQVDDYSDDYGWDIDQEDGQLYYIIQISPDEAVQMQQARRAGSRPREKYSYIPKELIGKFDRVAYRIGTARLRRHPSLEVIRNMPTKIDKASIANVMDGAIEDGDKFANVESPSTLYPVQGRGGIPSPTSPPPSGQPNRNRNSTTLSDRSSPSPTGIDTLPPSSRQGLPNPPSGTTKYSDSSTADTTNRNLTNPSLDPGWNASGPQSRMADSRNGYGGSNPYGSPQNQPNTNTYAYPQTDPLALNQNNGTSTLPNNRLTASGQPPVSGFGGNPNLGQSQLAQQWANQQLANQHSMTPQIGTQPNPADTRGGVLTMEDAATLLKAALGEQSGNSEGTETRPSHIASKSGAGLPSTSNTSASETAGPQPSTSAADDTKGTGGESSQESAEKADSILTIFLLLSLVVNVYLGMLIRKLLSRYRNVLANIRSQTA